MEKLVNVTNAFCKKGMKELENVVDSGQTALAYVDCIGFTRADNVGRQYAVAMREKYGDSIEIEADRSCPHFTEWKYTLKR